MRTAKLKTSVIAFDSVTKPSLKWGKESDAVVFSLTFLGLVAFFRFLTPWSDAKLTKYPSLSRDGAGGR